MSLGLFLYIIFLLATNVMIGYVIAILMGIGPCDFRAAWALIKSFPPVKRFPRVPHLPIQGMQGVLDRLTPLFNWFGKFFRRKVEENAVAVDETTEEKLQKISEKEVDELLEDESAAITQVAPVPELFDDNLMNIIYNHGTDIWKVSDKHIEASIYKLNLLMMESGQFAGVMDEKLRSMQDHATLEEIRQACKTLADDCRNYLNSQSKITTDIQSRVEEFGELRGLAEEIDHSNLEQVSQIESTLGNLDSLAQSEDIADSVGRLLQELANLRQARHKTRDIQDRAIVAICRSEDRMGSINRSETFTDKATELNNRIAFQTYLWEWWQQERHKKTKLTFALYDISGFTELNNRLGIRVCDKIVTALAQWIDERVEGRDFAGLYSGNCLVSVSSNIGLRKTVAFVERIRQEVEHTQFVFADRFKDISIHLTCAVTEATEWQTETELISVLDQTLASAKRAGRNLTFMYDPAKLTPAPEPVESPQLSIEYKVFDLTTMQPHQLSVGSDQFF